MAQEMSAVKDRSLNRSSVNHSISFHSNPSLLEAKVKIEPGIRA
ncbi:MAG: hypothetical protein AB1757_20465 [Acidobacteriota bacterium]